MYKAFKVISRISQTYINRHRRVIRASLLTRRRKKRVCPHIVHVQFVRFPLTATAPRLKFKCDRELARAYGAPIYVCHPTQ